jgi:hypothetical protein
MKFGIFAFVAIHSSAPALADTIACTYHHDIAPDSENGPVNPSRIHGQDGNTASGAKVPNSQMSHHGETYLRKK